MNWKKLFCIHRWKKIHGISISIKSALGYKTEVSQGYICLKCGKKKLIKI